MKRKRGKLGQVWIETMVYTLIAFVMMGLVLGFARPKINEIQDNAVISQSITMMQNIDSTISDIKTGGKGNKRILEVGIKKGSLKIDGNADKITFDIDIKHAYSEPGNSVENGNLIILTQEHGSFYNVSITRDYSDSYDIRYVGNDEEKVLSKSPNPYKLTILNKEYVDEKTVIDFEAI